MKKHLLITTAGIILSVIATDAGAQMSREAQLEMIGYYKLVLEGRAGVPTESQELLELDDSSFPIKCGTSIATSYASSFKKFDKDLVDKHSLALWPRPTETDEFYDSPAGFFKIHFTRTGSHAVYQPSTTTGGIPNYVLGVALICDSVYNHIISTLGYPAPPSDGGYPAGIDSRYDIYVTNLGGSFFGLTYPDSLPFSGSTALDGTSFIEIDNDYQESGFGPYRAQPLNAVRVTTAHEYFHAVQFGIDVSETEIDTSAGFEKRYWFEMSATWMEEEIYDDINDYYTVIPFFFNRPRSSIQQFLSPLDFHPYASCVFPIFLSEKFGSDIIRAIWIKCGQLGIGPSMLEAADIVIDSVTSGTENFRSVFGEFTLWNFFTGSRAALAPIGVGYEERAFYPEIPDTAFSSVFNYPVSVLANSNPKSPSANSAGILRLNNLNAIFYTDSTDTALVVQHAFGAVTSDSLLPQGWHIHRLLQLNSDTTTYIDSSYTFPDNSAPVRRIYNPRDYRSATFIFTPASWKWEAYTSSSYDTRFGYVINDSLALSPNQPAVVFAPYPNPANVNEMNGANLRFRFQLETDSSASPVYSSAYSVIDIFTVVGELIKTIDDQTPQPTIDPLSGTLQFELDWNMRTDAGKDAASGVYICLLRMYTSSNRDELLLEEMAKVLIVR